MNITKQIYFDDDTYRIEYKGHACYLSSEMEFQIWCALWGGTGMYGQIGTDHILDELRHIGMIDDEYDGKNGTFVYYYCKKIRSKLRRIGLVVRGGYEGWKVQEVTRADLLDPSA